MIELDATTSASGPISGAALRMLWGSMDRAKSGNRQVDVALILPVAVGWDENQRPYFMVIMDERPHAINMLQTMNIRIGHRTELDGKWTLKFTLLDESLFVTFSEFCCSVVDHIRRSDSASRAVQNMYRAIDEWMRLLKAAAQSNQMLNLRGVVAELVAALVLADFTSFSMQDLLDGWVGPYGAPQDYQLPNGYAYEVKSVYLGTKQIAISSAQQLDDTNLNYLGLCTVALQNADRTHEQAVTLQDVVDEIRKKYEFPPRATAIVTEALSNLGLQVTSDLVQETAFIVQSVTLYDVKDNFPRIRAENVPKGIERLTYSIRLADIEGYKATRYDEPLRR